MLWLVNKATRQALENHPDAAVLNVIRLGGVDAVLMHRAEAGAGGEVQQKPLSKRALKRAHRELTEGLAEGAVTGMGRAAPREEG